MVLFGEERREKIMGQILESRKTHIDICAKKLDLADNKPVVRKAAEFRRLSDVKFDSSALGIGEICKAIICLEIAANKYEVIFDRQVAIKLSGMSEKAYTRSFNSLQNVLDVKNNLDVRELAIQFGCVRIIPFVKKGLKMYKDRFFASLPTSRRSSTDFSRPVFMAVAFYLCAKKHKLKADKIKLIELCGTSESEFSSVSNSMKDLCHDVFGVLKEKKDPKQVKGNRELLDAFPEKTGYNDGGYSSNEDSEPIDGNGVGKIVASGHPKFQKGDFVVGRLIWAQYAVVEDVNLLRKLDPTEYPLSYHLGILGNLVGQYAKLFGCYVVGCASSNAKVATLKETLGFDDAFNYKEECDLKLALQRYFPEGIDIYFDNVGGEMLEAAVANMNPFGRVVACGVTPQYTDSTKRGRASPDMIDVIYKRITIQGYMGNDFDFYKDEREFTEFLSTTSSYLKAGQMEVLKDIHIGIESIPSAFVGLFLGRNIGKTIVKIADE